MKYLLLLSVLPCLCACEATGKLAGGVLMLPVRIFKAAEAPPQTEPHEDIQTAMAFDGDAP